MMINDVLVDACDEPGRLREALRGARPRLTIVLGKSPHHVGGLAAAPRPVLAPRHVLRLSVSGMDAIVLPGPAEAALVVPGRLMVAPCGVSLWVLAEAAVELGLRARCYVGGIAASTLSEYSVRTAVSALARLGVRIVVPVHTPPEIVDALARRFQVEPPTRTVTC